MASFSFEEPETGRDDDAKPGNALPKSEGISGFEMTENEGSNDEMTENEVSDNEGDSDNEIGSDGEIISDSESEFDPEYCYSCGGPGGLLTPSWFTTIEEAAQKGCPTCLLLRFVLENYFPQIGDADEQVSVCRVGGVYELIIRPNDPNLSYISVYGHGGASSPSLSIYENTRPANDLPEIIGNTSCAEALALAKKWISNCDETHEDCRQDNTSLLPTRVLDLEDPNAGDKISLYTTANEPARYICLSHCWGNQNLLKTEKGSFSARNEGIKWGDLPKTFQDAVTMTRALGVRYLWIDSLCIIQDDKEDWYRESAKMHTIYQDGYLTLAASKSKGPDGGMFSVATSHNKLEHWEYNSQEGLVYTRRKIQHFESRTEFPLLQRGWVFQERILSRRVLHFGSKELIWECMEHQTCECSFFKSSLGMDYGLGWKGTYRPEAKGHPHGWLMVVWWKIVKDYSTLKLSYDEDIFPALSGIAQAQMVARGSQYLAGLWEDTLVHDLLWYIPHRTRLPGIGNMDFVCGPRPSQWRAPTWSWASVKSAVEYDLYDGFDPAIDIEDWEIVPMGEEITGQLQEAWLAVSGQLALVTIHRRPEDSKRNSGSLEIFLNTDGKEVDNLQFYKDYDLWSEGVEQISDGEALHCLLVGKMFKPETSGKQCNELWFMMLREVKDNKDEYNRIGVAVMQVNEDEPCPEFLEEFVHEDRVTIG
jgi:hypothetical protein